MNESLVSTIEPLRISDSVSRQLHTYLWSNQPDNSNLRIGVKRGDCNRLSHILNFTELTEFDQIDKLNGVEFIFDNKYFHFFQSKELQISDELDISGF